MTRAFTSLDPQEALHVAVHIEERNAGIYHRFAEMFTQFGDPESLEIAGVFWDMAVEEKRHSALLQGKYEERYGKTECALTEEDLREMIEVPRLDDGDVFAAKGCAAAGPRERAMQVVLMAEKSANEFYTRLAEATKDGGLRRLYHELATMEDGHVVFLESLLDMRAAPCDGLTN